MSVVTTSRASSRRAGIGERKEKREEPHNLSRELFKAGLVLVYTDDPWHSS